MAAKQALLEVLVMLGIAALAASALVVIARQLPIFATEPEKWHEPST